MFTYFGEISPSAGVYKPRRNIKNELSLDEKLALIWAVSSDGGRFGNLRFYTNDCSFFDAFFSADAFAAVCRSCRGTYRRDDPYVKFNARGEVESYSADYVRAKIDEELDDVIAAFAKLLKDGKVRDWFRAFVEVTEE